MAKKQSILDLLAEELGYKNSKELKKVLSSSGTLKSRLESGQGFGEAIGGRTGELREEYLTKKGLTKKAEGFGKDVYSSFFKGDDIFSAYMRGRLVKKTERRVSSEPEKGEEKPSSLRGDSSGFLKIIAKESMSLPGIARDTNVLRQNLQKLVKLWGGEKATGADAQFLKSSEREEKLGVESEKERAKDIEFFKKEDEREAGLEKKEKPAVVVQQVAGEPEKESKGMFGGLLDTVMSFFKNGLLKGLMGAFNPMMLLKLLGKVFVVATIIISLFKGITAAFDRWKETGSLKEAIIAGLGAIVDFITFEFFGEDSIRKLFDTVGSFIDPVIETISGVIDDIKNWFKNNIGIPKITIPIPDILQKLPGVPKEISIGPYYPFKDKQEASATGSKSSAGKTGTPPSPNTDKTGTPAPANGAGTSAGTPAKETSDYGTADRKIKLPDGWQVDPTTGYYVFPRAYQLLGDIRLNPETTSQKDIDKINKEFIDKEKEKLSTSPSMARAGELVASAAGGGATPSMASSSSSSAGGEASPSMASGGATDSVGTTSSPEASLEPAQKISGTSLSETSADVAEKQRMESSADSGSMINAPTKNSNRGLTGEKPKSIPNVYNEEFLEFYATT